MPSRTTAAPPRPRPPMRTTPNGFCVECGRRIKNPTALRCRAHANALVNPNKAGTFTPERARAVQLARAARVRELRDENERLRSVLREHGIEAPTEPGGPGGDA